MKDFVDSLLENNMMLKLPAEYAEYLQTIPKEIVFHDPENEEQAKIAAKVKMKTVAFLVACSVVLWLLFIYVIASKNKFIVIFLMGVVTAAFTLTAISVIRKKTQVVTGRAVIKTKQRRHGKRKSYSYYVSVAVDEPEKAIYSNISVDKKDYEKIQEGSLILVVNVTATGKGVVLESSDK